MAGESKPKFSLEASLRGLPADAAARARERCDELAACLRAMPWHDGTIRDDSQLAWLFCRNEGLDAEDTAHEIASANFLYDQTSYPAIVEQRLRAAADVLRAAYPRVDWKVIWRQLTRYGVPVVKHAAMFAASQKEGGSCPAEGAACPVEGVAFPPEGVAFPTEGAVFPPEGVACPMDADHPVDCAVPTTVSPGKLIWADVHSSDEDMTQLPDLEEEE